METGSKSRILYDLVLPKYFTFLVVYLFMERIEATSIDNPDIFPTLQRHAYLFYVDNILSSQAACACYIFCG